MDTRTSGRLDALVVGGGPVGMAMALDLARHGVRYRVIDKATEVNTLSKAVVLMPRTLEELELRGMADDVLARCQRVYGWCAYADGRLVMRTGTARLESRYDFLACLGQTETEAILRRRLADAGRRVELGVELTDFRDLGDRVVATLRGREGRIEEVEADYLVGCDGAHSRVRHGLGVAFEGAQYKDVWALGDVVIDWRYPRDRACAFFHPEGYVAVFPLPGGRSRVFAVGENQEAMGPETTLDQLQGFLDRWSFVRSRLSDPRWLAQFHVHHRIVSRYKVGRVFLAGDAAHIHSPETGLGMNTGIQDAFNLAWKLAWVVSGRARPSLLESYDLERSAVGRDVVAASNTAHVLSAQFGPIGRAVRNRIFALLNRLYRLHYESVQKQHQLDIDYASANGASIRDYKHHAHVLPMDRLPLPGRRARDGRLLRLPDGRETSLYGEIANATRLQLLVLTGMEARPEAYGAVRDAIAVARGYGEWLDCRIVLGREATEPLAGIEEPAYLDPSLEFHELYGADASCLFLIRPDGYVALRIIPIRAADLREYLEAVFGPRPAGGTTS